MKQDGSADNYFSTFLSSKMTINPFHEAKITSNQTMWKALAQDQGVLKGQGHASMKKEMYNVTVSDNIH